MKIRDVVGQGRIVAALLVPVVLSVSVSVSVAQYTWKKIASFPTAIGCGYFFDADHGLIGMGVRWSRNGVNDPCKILKTSNGGMNWTECQIPSTPLPGAITAISMIDHQTGYASIMPAEDLAGSSVSALWKTTDGGNTWTDDMNFSHALTCVRAIGNTIVTTSWDSWDRLSSPVDGGLYSTNGGASWNRGFDNSSVDQLWSGNGANGIDFSDSLNGVVVMMNPDQGGSSHWYTTDGGRIWQPTVSTNQMETWSVYAVKGKRIYFTANESQLAQQPRQQVNWSTDGGATWSRRAYFPHMQFTGTINGMDSVLYFQTDTTFYDQYADRSVVRGVYRSTDLGATWKFVGGPSHSRDTRFVVTGCSGEVVYIFDGEGGVWKTIDGGDGLYTPKNGNVDMNIPLTAFSLHATDVDVCKPVVQAVPFYTTGCGLGMLDSASITGAQGFIIGDARGFPRSFGSDSVVVEYHRPLGNMGAYSDTATLHLSYTTNGTHVTKNIPFVVQLPAITSQDVALPRRAVVVGSKGNTVPLNLKEILPTATQDSLQKSGLTSLNFLLGYDPAQLTYTFYSSPATLKTSRVTLVRPGLLSVILQRSSWTYQPGDFDLGTASFIIQTQNASTALVKLQELGLVTSNGGVTYPCLTTREDHEWEIVVQSTSDVAADAQHAGVQFTPSPFHDHLIVTNSEQQPLSLTLYDLLGRSVSTFEVSALQQNEWNTSQLQPGIYVITWQEHGTLHSIKLTKSE